MTKNIFLVDDDETDVIAIGRSLRTMIQEGKFDLDIFRDGEAVTERLEEIGASAGGDENRIPDIMLLDLNMPKMGGFEVLDKIRNNHKFRSMVVFILSTSNNPDEIKRAYCKNVAGYLVKGEMGNMYEKLRELLETYSDTVALPPN
ncbi:MAG: CheY-like chemotaxis protein [Nitrospinales bacterium]|jgi:CheY-like chemotaxis protein